MGDVFRITEKEKRFWNESDIAPHLDQVKSTGNLVEIDLAGNSYSEEVVRLIVDKFAGEKQIERAILKDMFTGRLKSTIPPAIGEFVRLFEENSRLTMLDLSDNAFGPLGARALKPILVNNPSIEVLHINNNGLGPEGGRIIAEGLVESFEVNVVKNGGRVALRTIVIGRNRLESSSIELAKAISRLPSVEQVCLPQNGIRPEWIGQFFINLRGASKLRVLDVQDNTMTESGTLALAECIEHWPLLEELNLADCLMRSRGTVVLMKRLCEVKPGLCRLNMQFNELNEQCVLSAVELVKSLSTLQALHLNGNTFDPQGIGALRLIEAVESMGKADILDEWDEMEYDSDEDSEADELLERLENLTVE